jgi:hypothetical protein
MINSQDGTLQGRALLMTSIPALGFDHINTRDYMHSNLALRQAATDIHTLLNTIDGQGVSAVNLQQLMALGLDVLRFIQPFLSGNTVIGPLIAEAIAILQGLQPAPPA